MAEAISAVRLDVSADTAKLQEGMKKAEGIIRAFGSNAEKAGKVAGEAIAGAFIRVGGMITAAFGAQSITQFAVESLHAAAALGRFADQAGLTVQQFQGLDFALRGAHVPTEQLAQGFAIFSRNLSDLHRNTGPFLDFLQRYAPQLVASFRATRDTYEAFGVLTDAVNSLGNQYDRVRLLTAAGAEQFGRLANSMRQGRPAIDEQTRSFQGLANEAVRRAQEIEDKWDKLWRNLKLAAQQAVVGASEVLSATDTTSYATLSKELVRLHGIYDTLSARGRDASSVFAQINKNIDEQVRLLGLAYANADRLANAPEPKKTNTGLTTDQIRAMQGQLQLFMAQLSTMPPQTEFISTSFAAAWEKMRQSMLANKATLDEVQAAKINLLRQEDAERMRILGNSIAAEEQLQRRRTELHQAREAQLISEEQLQRALQQANLDQAAATVGALGQGLSAMASAWPKVKGFAIAATIANTAQGVMKAYADPHLFWPLNVAVAGMIAAAGVANIAKISSTNPGSGGGGGISASAPSVGGGAESAPTQPQQMMTVNLAPGRYTREEVLGLMEQMNEAMADGAQLVINR
jgi:hypothetical protein